MADVGLDMPVSPSALRRAKSPVVVLAVVLAIGALAVPWAGRLLHRGAPFRPSQMNLSLNLAVVPVSDLQPAIEGFGISDDQLRATPPSSEGQEAVVGQLSFTIPKPMPDGSQMALFVIDARSHRLTQLAWGYSGGANPPVSGYDGSFGEFATRFQWLKPTAPIFQDGSYIDPGMAISIPPGAQSPLTFYAVLDPTALPVSDVSQDVSVTLGFVGPDRQIYWAQRIQPPDSGQ
jgi:hypothetical protein